MRLTTLIENTPGTDPRLVPQHGLSLLIESGDRTVLFDMGQDGTYIRNAENMDLDLSRVDVGVLSHGHYDHGGGLAAFLEYNTRAPVYLRAGADGAIYAKDPSRYRYIGLERDMLSANAHRLIWISTDTTISPGLVLITGRQTTEPPPPGSNTLLVRKDGRFEPDLFQHELFLVVEEVGGITVITGCGHSGILNIVYTAKQRCPGRPVKAVVGGFHLTNRDTQPEMVYFIANTLKSAGCGRIITGHCTGTRAQEILRAEFGDRFSVLSTGYRTEI